MITKDIEFAEDLRGKLGKGVQKLSDAVKVTMGPRGRNVLIEGLNGSAPHITKDGVTVARSISLEDPYENMGSELVKSVAVRTAMEAGDGTTTATVLAAAIFREGLSNVTAGANPIELKRGMDKACEAIVKNIAEMSVEISTKEQIQQIATLSANSDEAVGNIIAEAMDAVGTEGVITIEEAKGLEDELEVVQGMRNNSGMLSPHFTDSQDKIETVFEKPYILLYNGRLTELKGIVHILEEIQKSKRPLLIVSDDIDNDVLNTLVVNKMRGSINCCAIKSNGYGVDKAEQLEDFAVLTGARVISDEQGEQLTNVKMSDLGTCDKSIHTLRNTTIIGGPGDVQPRIERLRRDLEDANPMLAMQVNERIGRLSGGVGILRIAAPTSVEMKEKRDRVDDSLAATRAAIAEGIVIGGGCALIKASNIEEAIDVTGDQLTGAKIIQRAVRSPLHQIAENAGYEGAVIINKIEDKPGYIGFDASTGLYVDMFKTGIIDPAKVERVALQQAISVASLLLTSEAGIVSTKKD